MPEDEKGPHCIPDGAAGSSAEHYMLYEVTVHEPSCPPCERRGLLDFPTLHR